jgi:hypothetical protein
MILPLFRLLPDQRFTSSTLVLPIIYFQSDRPKTAKNARNANEISFFKLSLSKLGT